MVNYDIYTTRFGEILIAADEEGLVAVRVCCRDRHMQIVPHWRRRATALTDRAAGQLEEYFAGYRRKFDLPLNPRGTDFQRRVWKQLLRIPYGETCSYRQQAEALGTPRGNPRHGAG